MASKRLFAEDWRGRDIPSLPEIQEEYENRNAPLTLFLNPIKRRWNMKGKRIGWSGLAVLVMAVTFFLSPAHAQVPDLSLWEGTWHRLNLRETELEFDGSKMVRSNLNSTLFLNINNQNGAILNATIWVQEGGSWMSIPIPINIIGGTSLDFLCYVELKMTDIFGTTFLGFTAQVTGRMTGGVLRSASMKSLGGYSWEIGPGDALAGSVSINGSLMNAAPIL